MSRGLHLAGDVLAGLLADKGRLAGTKALGPDQHPAAVAIRTDTTVAALDRLVSDVAAGPITVKVSRTYALAEVPAALADFAVGALGKLAVTVA